MYDTIKLSRYDIILSFTGQIVSRGQVKRARQKSIGRLEWKGGRPASRRTRGDAVIEAVEEKITRPRVRIQKKQKKEKNDPRAALLYAFGRTYTIYAADSRRGEKYVLKTAYGRFLYIIVIVIKHGLGFRVYNTRVGSRRTQSRGRFSVVRPSGALNNQGGFTDFQELISGQK